MTRLAQANDRSGLILMAAMFCLTSSSVAALRIYARKLQRQSIRADDWFALAGTILVLGLNAVFIAGTSQGIITGHSPVVNDWPVSTETEHNAERYKYAFQTTEKITFGILKISVILLWHRIFGHVRRFRIFCWIMIVVITAWSLAFFFGTVFQCGTNWALNWAPIGLFLTECSNTLDMLSAFAATDILTDFIIMFMPIPMIWSLQLQVRKKLAITGMFTVGFFVVGAGIARLYVYLVTSYDKQDNPDFIGDFTLFILWSDVEANIAVISACLPTLLPVVNRGVAAWNSVGGSQLSKFLLSTFRSKSTVYKSSFNSNAVPYAKNASSDMGSNTQTTLTKHPLDPHMVTHISSATPIRQSAFHDIESEQIIVHHHIDQHEG